MTASLTVIAPFWRRHENIHTLLDALRDQSYDELWVVVEDETDLAAWSVIAKPHMVPTPKVDGKYTVIPYSNAINYALDRTTADYITYLDNGSVPQPDKYRIMREGLDEHPEWGVVYCGQRQTGWSDRERPASQPIPVAYGSVNFTQVMHRRSPDRWPLDLSLANPDLADAVFFRSLNERFGSFYPVGVGRILDDHHMPSVAAQNL